MTLLKYAKPERIWLRDHPELHVIRAIEYWDIERKRYPQYDHTGPGWSTRMS
jgi:hypothetical protein